MDKPMVDRYGLCPKCKASWEGGDVYKTLNSLEVFMNTSEKELTAVAANYGWTQEDHKKFSRIIIHEITPDQIFYQCPEIRCGAVFNSLTGQQYWCLSDAIHDENETKPEEVVAGTRGELVDIEALADVFHDPTGFQLIMDMDAIPKVPIAKIREELHKAGIKYLQENAPEAVQQIIDRDLKSEMEHWQEQYNDAVAKIDEQLQKDEDNDKKNTGGSISNLSQFLKQLKK